MEFIYSDGGRSKYFKATNVGDCVTRAICNATGKDYKEVYDRLKQLATQESTKRHRGGKRSSVRDGVFKETWKKYLAEIGWVHVSTMGVGTGIQVHLNEEELPNDIVMIVQVSKHLTCVKNGVLYDTYDCTRDGERGVYGYWRAPNPEEIAMQEIYEQEIEAAKVAEEAYKTQKRERTQEKQKIRYEYYLEIAKLKRQIAKLERERDEKISNLD